jgi:hypothetical protein
MRGPEVIALLLVLAAVTLIWALHVRYRQRELVHRERMSAIEKGVPLPESREAGTPRIYLLRGMIWLFAGISLSALLLGVSLTTGHSRSYRERLITSEQFRRMGASPEQVQQLLTDNTPEPALPLGVCLLGLVPAGVGIAYLIFYRVERKSS